MFVFKKEKELEEHLVKNFNRYFGFDFYCNQYVFWTGGRIDIVGKDKEDTYYIIEVKRDRICKYTVNQVLKYIPLFERQRGGELHPLRPKPKKFVPMVVAPFCDSDARVYAKEKSVIVKTIEDVMLADNGGDFLVGAALDVETTSRIDKYRKDRYSRSRRAEVIRQLIKLGLEHQPPN